MSRPRLIALLLALITFGLYLPVAWHEFSVYDDGLYVTDNPVVQQGVTWHGVKWAFTTMAASNWHPVTWLSHMVDCGLFGLDPAGPHLENALLHALNTALLFVLLFRLSNFKVQSPDPNPQPKTLWPAAFIAALFAWHPMHVESVAWIAERKDVLSTFFALLALLAYVDYVTAKAAGSSRAKIHFGWSLMAFAIGLMAKPMIVTLPCVLLLLDFWPLRRIENFKLSRANFKLLLEKCPYFLITAGSCVATFVAQSQKQDRAVVSLNIVPLHYRLENTPLAYVDYLWKTVWPTKLAVFYPLHKTIPPSSVAVSVALLLVISFAVWRWRRTQPYLLTGWLWFLGMLVPVIGIVQVGSAALADRYSYLSSVGIFIMITFGVCDLAARFKIPKPLLAGAATVILAASTLVMEKQLSYWRNSVTLFRHALAVTRNNDISRNNLGVALQEQGRLSQAAAQYRIAARLEPDRFQAHHNLADLLGKLGHPKEALAEHRKAVQLAPQKAFLHTSLGKALASAGQTDAALKEFFTAAQLNPHSPWPHVEIAKTYLRQGRDAAALKQMRTALQCAPNDPDILAYTAQLLAASENPVIRNGDAAFVLAAKANVLTGGHRPFILDVLGMACAEMGKFDDAQLAAQQAIAIATAMKMKGLAPIQHRLELYQKHQPWREAFGFTNHTAVTNEATAQEHK